MKNNNRSTNSNNQRNLFFTAIDSIAEWNRHSIEQQRYFMANNMDMQRRVNRMERKRVDLY